MALRFALAKSFFPFCFTLSFMLACDTGAWLAKLPTNVDELRPTVGLVECDGIRHGVFVDLVWLRGIPDLTTIWNLVAFLEIFCSKKPFPHFCGLVLDFHTVCRLQMMKAFVDSDYNTSFTPVPVDCAMWSHWKLSSWHTWLFSKRNFWDDFFTSYCFFRRTSAGLSLRESCNNGFCRAILYVYINP